MKTQELIEYLQGFDPKTDVSIGVVNIAERKKYYTEMVVVTDGPVPAIFLDVIGSVGFDEEECQAADEIESKAEND